MTNRDQVSKLVKTPEQIEGIRESAKINVAVLDHVSQHIREGMTTEEIDQLVHQKTLVLGGIPAPLGYEGFPKSTCTSVNDQVCHGIPSEKDIIRDGDIINVDVSTIYKGYFSDSSRMFCIGNVSQEKRQLVNVTKECMYKGVEAVKPGGYLGDIGHAIFCHAREFSYTVVREVGGHGIGLAFHEDPWVSHVAEKGTGIQLVPGLVFTIEPMINMGAADIFMDESNGWTIYTADGSPSAQWEVMVVVNEDGCEILAY